MRIEQAKGWSDEELLPRGGPVGAAEQFAGEQTRLAGLAGANNLVSLSGGGDHADGAVVGISASWWMVSE